MSFLMRTKHLLGQQFARPALFHRIIGICRDHGLQSSAARGQFIWTKDHISKRPRPTGAEIDIVKHYRIMFDTLVEDPPSAAPASDVLSLRAAIGMPRAETTSDVANPGMLSTPCTGKTRIPAE